MKRVFRIMVLAGALLMALSAPSHAHGGWGWGLWPLGIGLGIGLGVASQPHYYYPYYSYPAPVGPMPGQQVYVPQQPASAYWYYCREAGGYYPYVRQCPTGWMKVVPSPPPPPQ
ncbi:hypothetical protein [Geobacter sp. SVR]|uniref:hypothetical protein n=1 Tax=Geobacter sp. SVR TaxID=2495594 RepID=UPI00143EFCA8|nr:hypothetical protein [Geobacter sp. SVR]BCS52513.1 hypothetical protein GSVR_08210 [Geobacter sp. SVR]GCF84050.1 hypothetical protein GSbR_06500 [Geobacter sp. SVR]